ncbi:glycoside hydrolase family 9 protein [Conexibacter sp. CPCC 206217]|uniref:glycoside hydrolase family 9 protein n=1 Tax=Conexibacter sp. CPCC 206217 TaxID=3064574 RepID=UPI0027213522|nr:glycoside hydrolase family 9 protein [Conexibacter sp. CPCC 206217]MDO8209533.1 glycoside hydrolase family 9 protein [Conexibacter sp. CPCC 206217]
MAVLLALGAAACGASSASATPPDAIRVGGPSAPGDAKVAIVGSGGDLRGRAFRVVDSSGRAVLRGRLAGAGGSAAPWRHAARADLSRVRAPGAYRVRFGDLTSRPWIVRTNAVSAPIRAILGFFAANADGREPSPAHGPAHLRDAVVATGPHAGEAFDLTGGWMDAGDMLKFTHTTAYAAAALQVAARLDRADAPALTAAADVGVRWLLKAHPAPDLFIAQVGDERDHELGFRDPAGDDASGKVGIATRVAYANIGGDLGGKAAAALALAAERAGAAPASQAASAPALLDAARDWYAAGVAAGGVAPKLGAPSGDFYSGDTAQDALAAGAAALYRVTGERRYLDDALRYLGAITPDGRLGWNAMAGFAAADLCGALGAPGAADRAARATACAALGAQGRAALARARRGAFRTPGDFTWGQTGESSGAGALAAFAGGAIGLPGGLAGGAAARDWLLGRNPWGASFVTGYGPKAPRHPHHWSSLAGPGRPRGAVVGGPAPLADILAQDLGAPRRSPFDTAGATYEDRVDDYVTSEPAIDYAASAVLLLAALAGR